MAWLWHKRSSFRRWNYSYISWPDMKSC